MKKILIAFIMACVMALLVPVKIQAQQVSINARMLTPDIKVFMLNDLNLTGKGSSTLDIFEVTIGEVNLLTTATPFTIFLRIWAQNLGELASGVTDPFVLNPGERIRITNRNLFSTAERFSLSDYSIEDQVTDLVNRILATGKLPSDNYFFEFTLENTRNGQRRSAQISFAITNPTRLDLVAPGSDADRDRVDEISTTWPIFRWESDMDHFRLIIAEKMPGVHDGASAEQIIQDRIRFDQVLSLTPRAGAASITGTFFQYPFAGAWPLEAGKTYFWQIKGLVQSGGAVLELPSEIWAFKINSLHSAAGPGAALSNYLLSLLEGLPGDLREILEAIAGYSLTGTFIINGKSITQEELIQLLLKIQAGEYSITNLSIE